MKGSGARRNLRGVQFPRVNVPMAWHLMRSIAYEMKPLSSNELHQGPVEVSSHVPSTRVLSEKEEVRHEN